MPWVHTAVQGSDQGFAICLVGWDLQGAHLMPDGLNPGFRVIVRRLVLISPPLPAEVHLGQASAVDLAVWQERQRAEGQHHFRHLQHHVASSAPDHQQLSAS